MDFMEERDPYVLCIVQVLCTDIWVRSSSGFHVTSILR